MFHAALDLNKILFLMTSFANLLAKVLSRFNNIILARVFGHADVVELAEFATVPGEQIVFCSEIVND